MYSLTAAAAKLKICACLYFEMEKPFSCHSDAHSKSGLSMAEQKMEMHLNISPAVLRLSNQGHQRQHVVMFTLVMCLCPDTFSVAVQ